MQDAAVDASAETVPYYTIIRADMGGDPKVQYTPASLVSGGVGAEAKLSFNRTKEQQAARRELGGSLQVLASIPTPY